jgi:hypothetical protein
MGYTAIAVGSRKVKHEAWGEKKKKVKNLGRMVALSDTR